MVIPGWLLLSIMLTIFSICSICGCCDCCSCCYHSGFYYLICISDSIYFNVFITFVISYIIGLIWNMFMDFVFVIFTNNELCVWYIFDDDGKRILIYDSKKDLYHLFENNIAYKTNKSFSFPNIIIIGIQIFQHLKKTKDYDYYKLYFISYYYALKNKYSDDIPIMEGQIMFLRNMILIFILYAFAPSAISCGLHICCNCPTIISLIILSLLSYFTMISRQIKVSQRVWEDSFYLSRILFPTPTTPPSAPTTPSLAPTPLPSTPGIKI